MSYREETLTVRARHIRLLRAGPGQPLLYLHDTFHYTWTRVHDALAAHYEVLFPVHPGCAGSADLDDIDGMDDLVFHYLDICATLGLERPVLLGPSLGGWLAAEWAVRYPEMLRALILVDAFGLRLPEAPATDLLRLDAAQMRQVLFADPHAAVAQDLIPDVPAPESLEARFRARQTLARFAWQFPDNPKLRRYLYRLRTPTLIIWGAQDGVVSTAHAQAYLRGIAGAELVVLPRCGHLPLAEQPAAGVQAVLHYLARLGA
jgi:pimeloyl-ACP methyl ester carboxylesterase